MSKSEKINWPVVCGQFKGELLGLRIECSTVAAVGGEERGQQLLREAQRQFQAGDRKKARAALKAAQKLGWNDLDLAVALDRK